MDIIGNWLGNVSTTNMLWIANFLNGTFILVVDWNCKDIFCGCVSNVFAGAPTPLVLVAFVVYVVLDVPERV